jgi:DNA invertase Pin-like site-specific DNA recombinase
VVDVFHDNDTSAWSRRRKRAGYDALMSALRSGACDALLVYHLDRLYRQPRELEDLLDLCDDGRIGFAACSGEYDLSEPDGRFMARMMVNVANKSSADLSRRQRRKMIEVAEAGRPHGGPRPYGYRTDRVTLDDHEAAVIREIAADIIDGASVRSVCLRLNARGDLTPFGKTWEPTVLSRMLLRRRLIAIRTHNGTEHAAAWPPILTEEQHLWLRARLSHPQRPHIRGAPGRYLLSGLLFCGVCGARMVRWPGWGRNKPAYACPAKPRGNQCVSVAHQPLDAFISAAVLAALENVTVNEQSEALPDTVGPLRLKLDELAAMWASDVISSSEYRRARGVLEARINAEEQLVWQQIERRSSPLPLKGQQPLRNLWPDLPTADRRKAIEVVISRIDVQSATRTRVFNPDRLHVSWRV